MCLCVLERCAKAQPEARSAIARARANDTDVAQLQAKRHSQACEARGASIGSRRDLRPIPQPRRTRPCAVHNRGRMSMAGAPMRAKCAGLERARGLLNMAVTFSMIRRSGRESIGSGGAALVVCWLSWQQGPRARVSVGCSEEYFGMAWDAGSGLLCHAPLEAVGYTAKTPGYTTVGKLGRLGGRSKARQRTRPARTAVYSDQSWTRGTPP